MLNFYSEYLSDFNRYTVSISMYGQQYVDQIDVLHAAAYSVTSQF